MSQKIVMGRKFWTYFKSISFLYFTFFYFIPSVFLLGAAGSIFYAGRTFYFTQQDVYELFFYGGLFIMAFAASNKYLSGKIIFTTEDNSSHNEALIKTLGLVYLLISFIYFLLFVDVNVDYAAKQGLEKGSRGSFLFSIVFWTFGVYLIFLLDEIGARKSALTLILGIFLINIFSGAGRFVVLLYAMMVFLAQYRGEFNRMLLAILFALFLLFFPILLNMKSIVYGIAVDKNLDFAMILGSYDFDVLRDGFFDNFGHPVVSMLIAPSLVEKIGFRYFYDYLQGFLFFFRLLGIDFGDSLTYFNTEEILGSRSSVIPPGYIAFGYLQMHLLGVLVSGVLYSFVGYMANWVRASIFPNSRLACFYFSFVAANSFYHGEVRLIVMTVFFGFIIMLTLKKLFKLKFKLA